MARPIKPRLVRINPNITYFKPRAVPLFELEEVNLKLDELEAIRLRDELKLSQKDAAKRMNISVATFQRILNSARHKIAEGLLHGKAIAIQNRKSKN